MQTADQLLYELKSRACRAHDLCNQLRLKYPEIAELGDDGELHDAIHDILRVDTPSARQSEGVSDEVVRHLEWVRDITSDPKMVLTERERERIHRYASAALTAEREQEKAEPVADDGRFYVEARQCEDCDHLGINDSSDTVSACSDCEWRGPTPDEDKCPGCAHQNCMAVACPICGGRYRFLADRWLEHDTAPAAERVQEKAEPVEISSKLTDSARSAVANFDRKIKPIYPISDAKRISATDIDVRIVEAFKAVGRWGGDNLTTAIERALFAAPEADHG